MTSQDNVGGDGSLTQPPAEPPKPAAPPTPPEPTDITSAPPPDKSRIGKLIVYAIVAVILIGACNAFSKEGGDTQNGSDPERKGFFQSLFGGGDEQDETMTEDESQQDPFMIPDGKG
jgi:hypothetical protein